jgi:hypothetical protein
MLACAGCGDRAVSTARRPGLGGQARLISQDDYGDAWPFGPNQGVLRCRRGGAHPIVTFEVGGVAYGLSVSARQNGYRHIRAILLTDHAGLAYDYSSVLRAGLALCRG